MEWEVVYSLRETTAGFVEGKLLSWALTEDISKGTLESWKKAQVS